MRRTVVVCLALVLAFVALPLRSSPASAATPPFQQLASEVYFSQTGHHLHGEFLTYWWNRGGVDIFGFPLTEEFTDPTTGLTVQYFQRARFEFHPNAPTGFRVQLTLLGSEAAQGRTDAAFRSPVPSGYQYQNNADHVFFPETGHFLSYGFKTFWENNGGLAIFGYPISEEFSENRHTVQYFQRAVFEYHPEFAGTKYAVELALLGTTAAQRSGAPIASVAQRPGTPVWPNGMQRPAKWIEIDLSRPQKLTAWEGDTPVYSTLVSGGVADYPTPTGVFQIQTKLRYDDMTGGLAGTSDYYYLPNVPYVMYFYTGGYALHGTYWHNNFGNPMSHGCVNLPTDAAQWIYNWAPQGTLIWIHGDPNVWR